MSDSEQKTNKLIAKMAKTYQLLAEQQTPHTIGQYVMEALLAGQAISKEGLQSWIAQKLTNTPTAKGNRKAENDVEYQVYFAVQKFIEGIEGNETNNDSQ